MKKQCESCQQFGKGECNAFKCIARGYCDWEEIKRPKSMQNKKNLRKPIDYASKLCLYGKITEQHAKDINEILNNDKIGNSSNSRQTGTLEKELKGIIISNIDGDMRLDNIEWLLTDLENWIDENYVPKQEFKQVSNPLDEEKYETKTI
jgi:hypothetical protein